MLSSLKRSLLDRIMYDIAHDVDGLGPVLPADAMQIHLLQGTIAPTQDLTVAALDALEADFPSYAPLPLSGSYYAQYRDPATDAIVLSAGEAAVIVTAPIITPQTIYGYYVTNVDGTIWHVVSLFDVPIMVTREGQAIVFEVKIQVSPSAFAA